MLWVSPASRFARDAAIRGGVPICFPWFGALAGHPESPSHGFARLSEWSIVRAENDGQDVIVRLRLTDEDVAGASPWPYRFEAIFTVVVGVRLSLSLQVTNHSGETVTFEEAGDLGVANVAHVKICVKRLFEGHRFTTAVGDRQREGQPGPRLPRWRWPQSDTATAMGR